MRERRPRLEGKVAIVTGAGSRGPGTGTGKAISILFASEGARVLLVDLIAQRAEETLHKIQESGGEASVFVADVTRAQDCEAMVEAAWTRYGGLHVLINNVGISAGRGTVMDLDPEDWDRVLDTNVKGMMLTSKYAIPAMIEKGGGSIVNLSSIEGLREGGFDGESGTNLAYSVSKGGVVSLTKSMAVQHGRENIRVNCIAPGHIYTPMIAPKLTEDTRDLRRRAGPLGTEGTAWDIAWATLFLASDESRWISGVVLPVDAGLLATTPLAMWQHLK